MRPSHLTCINGCPDGRFIALNAPLFVDSRGAYAGHDASRATYVCAVCDGVAIDVAQVAREMESRGDSAEPPTLHCPACGISMLPPEDDPLATVVECPGCETRFAVEEGLRRVHGGDVLGDDGDIDAGYGDG